MKYNAHHSDLVAQTWLCDSRSVLESLFTPFEASLNRPQRLFISYESLSKANAVHGQNRRAHAAP